MDKENKIVITEKSFDQAIITAMADQMMDPDFKGHPDAAMAFTMAGTVFARKIKGILFNKGESGNDQ